MQLTWFLNRLLKMSLPEIPWRFWEKSKKIIDKHSSWTVPRTVVTHCETLYKLSRNADPQTLKNCFSKEIKYHSLIADLALKNQYSAFGIQQELKNTITWHTDPVTQQEWPLKFWGDINYRDKRFGGAKFVWEINRLYFLSSLGILYRITKHRFYADKIIDIIISWVKMNPYPQGINWASGIELGIRMTNVIWALSFLHNYYISDGGKKAIHTFIWSHANHLYRYPSKFSSANNHLLAEGFGLFIAGVYFPDFKAATKWRSKGKSILEKEVSRQILPDGGSFEYSTTYLSFIFDFFLFFKKISDQNKIRYIKKIDMRLKKSCAFIKSLMDKSGNIPNIGDQDSALLIDFGISNMENFSSILNSGAILFDNNHLSTTQIDLKTFILTGESCNAYLRREKTEDSNHNNKLLESSPPAIHTLIHRESGLAIIRDNIDNTEILFTGNATPMGMPPLYAHGHLDALSFTLTVRGLEFFVDPGTYLYHSGGKWRKYFRSTASHNTLRLNMKDMSDQPGDFMFGKPYRIIKNTMKRQKNEIVWSASHNAYASEIPFAHISRTVIWKKAEKSFQIIDHIQQKKNSFADLHFHCHPDCRVICREKNIIVVRENITISISVDPCFKSQIYCGSLDPISGWYSPAFNKIMKSNTIRIYGNALRTTKIINNLKISFINATYNN